MTDKSNPTEIFNKLLEAIEGLDKSGGIRIQQLKAIHGEYDSAFADAMSRWIETQDVKISTVMATLSYMVGAECYYCSDAEEEICMMAEAHADYMHQVGHALWRKHGKAKSKKSS